MSFVQAVEHVGSSNEGRLKEWLWDKYRPYLSGWIQKSLLEVEPLQAFDRLERLTPILRMIGDKLGLSVLDIQPQHFTTATVCDLLSGQVSKLDGQTIAQLIEESRYPGSDTLAKEFLSVIKPRQTRYYRRQMPQVFEDYIHELSANGRDRKTIIEVRTRLGHFIRWAESVGIGLDGGVFLSIRPSHINRYMQFLRRLASNGDLSCQAAALNGERIVRVFQYFSTRYGVPNVAQGISPPKRPTEFPRWVPSKEQVQTFFESIIDYSPQVCRDVCLFGLLYAIGLRPFETANIRKRDVRVDLREVRITQKGGDDAIVSIPDSLAVWLGALVESTSIDGPIFAVNGRSMKEYERNLLCRLYGKIAAWPSIEGPGIFRHAFCTHLLLSGIDYLDINRLARHKDLRTTTHYLHLIKEQFRRSNQDASNLLLKGVGIDANTAQQ